MVTVPLTLKLVTPAYVGGFKHACEFRPTSLKGLMRFWWRASKAQLTLDDLRSQESAVFGGVGTGVSSFRLRSKVMVPSAEGPNPPRCFLPPGTTIELGLTFRREDETLLAEVASSLELLCAFGGIGSKARNGLGGLRVLSADHEMFSNLTKPPAELVKQQFVRVKSESRFSGTPPYTCFSDQARLLKTARKPMKRWKECLEVMQDRYREALRSAGLARKYVCAPVRGEEDSRRAKPLFFRVHETPDGYVGYVLYLPAQYSPKDPGATAKSGDACRKALCHMMKDDMVEVTEATT